jgi:site-specific DNA-adenine methylase
MIIPKPRVKRKKTPISWMGNKAGQLSDMHKALPNSFNHIIEPFAGSAAISLSLLEDGSITPDAISLNDIDAPLMAFWETLRDNPDTLKEGLSAVHEEHWGGNREIYEQAKKGMLAQNRPVAEQAHHFYVNNVLNAATVMRGGESNFCHPLNSGKGLREEWIVELKRFSLLIQGVSLSRGHYRNIRPASPDTLIVADPPYRIGKKKEVRFYGAPFNHNLFAKWCNRLKNQCQLLITYDDNPVHLNSFRRGWNIYRHPVFYASGARWDSELIITNYKIPFAELWCEDSGWEIIKEYGVFYPLGRAQSASMISAGNDNTPPFPNKRYEIVYADPPWPYYGNQTKMGATGNHYETMSLDEIKALDVQSISAKAAVCFMWATASSMHDVKGVMEAWGFHLNPNHFIWRKTRTDGVPIGASGVRPSYVKSANTEYLFIGSTRKNGRAPWVGVSDAGAAMVQIVDAPRLGHSQKPERFRELIMDLTGDRTRVELFARRAANDAWDVWGREAGS